MSSRNTHKRFHSEGEESDDVVTSAAETQTQLSEENGSSTSKETVDLPTVHSANSWESVNLGDDKRKAKFLKLMGASKKQHTGLFVIGEPDKPVERKAVSTETNLEQALEEQWKQSIQDHLKHKDKRHCGLGFADNLASPAAKPQDSHTHAASSPIKEEETSSEDAAIPTKRRHKEPQEQDN